MGVAPLATLLAFAVLVVYGARLGPGPALVALPAAVLGLLTVLLLSRLAVSLLGRLLSSRMGAVLAGLGSGTFLALTAQGWWLAVPLGRAGDLTWAPALARALPSGWGVVAVDARGAGDWTAAGALLVAQGALLVGLLAGWAALLARQVTTPRPSGHGPGGAHRGHRPVGHRPARRGAHPGAALVVARPDANRSADLLADLRPGVLPAPGHGGLVGPAPLGRRPRRGDGGRHLGQPVRHRRHRAVADPDHAGGRAGDVRGRQLAWLLVVAPVATLVTLAATALSGEVGAWPWVLALLPAVTAAAPA